MASISTFPALHFPFSKSSPIPSHSFSLPSPTNFTLSAASFRHSPLQGRSLPRVLKQVRAVEEDASVPELGVESEASSPSPSDPPAVTVPVSPSDVLTMFFQAEGTLNESAIPSVTGALEQTEGISGLKVQVVEGIASVALTKQTTIQSTGVASSLIETIQGAGFKLQTLNLSFEDEEEVFV
ncbi:uncharacterized protein LOC101219347 [Cucumis sativus]|uniref:Uncharacterized protein n=1 Tax=Cucumis sativus TaxID=3659 RepID=A0A0A0LC88_CUCSA|nr:uncharacterized protein LOC101219347 [Cucumis sativus]KGN59630.1 hypothetical protein Csa_001280 [Cucumis sativus]